MNAAHVLISMLNGVSIGLLLFLLASGLTLIFSMMGVLNFAHASFYMLGAYLAFTITQVMGFWWGLVLAPAVVGVSGAGFERFVLRRLQPFGHVAELLVTFGLSYVVLEVVGLVWGRQPLNFQPPAELQGPLFTIVESAHGTRLAWGQVSENCQGMGHALCTQFPKYRAFGMTISVLVLGALWQLLGRSRVGLIIQAALRYPCAAQALGHNVPRLYTGVFGGGVSLAALAGVIGGVMRVTEPSMASTVGALVFAVIVIGGMGSLAGAFIASLALGLIDSFAVGSDASVVDFLRWLGLKFALQGFGSSILKVKLSQLAALLPYLLLVCVLVLRPQGLLGTREG